MYPHQVIHHLVFAWEGTSTSTFLLTPCASAHWTPESCIGEVVLGCAVALQLVLAAERSTRAGRDVTFVPFVIVARASEDLWVQVDHVGGWWGESVVVVIEWRLFRSEGSEEWCALVKTSHKVSFQSPKL
jgi:hypothetical protein